MEVSSAAWAPFDERRNFANLNFANKKEPNLMENRLKNEKNQPENIEFLEA